MGKDLRLYVAAEHTALVKHMSAQSTQKTRAQRSVAEQRKPAFARWGGRPLVFLFAATNDYMTCVESAFGARPGLFTLLHHVGAAPLTDKA